MQTFNISERRSGSILRSLRADNEDAAIEAFAQISGYGSFDDLAFQNGTTAAKARRGLVVREVAELAGGKPRLKKLPLPPRRVA